MAVRRAIPADVDGRVRALRLDDDPDAVLVRSYWIAAGWHPPTA